MTLEEKRDQLVAEYRALLARMPWTSRAVWWAWCRLNRRRWAREERARTEAQWARIRAVVDMVKAGQMDAQDVEDRIRGKI